MSKIRSNVVDLFVIAILRKSPINSLPQVTYSIWGLSESPVSTFTERVEKNRPKNLKKEQKKISF